MVMSPQIHNIVGSGQWAVGSVVLGVYKERSCSELYKPNTDLGITSRCMATEGMSGPCCDTKQSSLYSQ
jgi:hypothetical protein